MPLNYYPKISIVTPNYNQADYLEETILSILNQNYPNLEYIIIDGGSTDHSVEIIKKYTHKLTYWISEKDNGQYDAINKGFLVSSGEIMSYINSDDLLSPYSLFSVAQIFYDYPQIEWLGGITHMIDENGRSIYVGKNTSWNKARYLNKDYKYIQQEGIFWRRNLWEKAGGYISTEFSMASDLELWSRFFLNTGLYNFPGILGSFRLRSSNQKTLDLMHIYYEEANEILDRIPRNKQEDLLIKKSKTALYKVLYRINSNILFKTFGYQKVNSWLHDFTSEIHFDRYANKFILTR